MTTRFPKPGDVFEDRYQIDSVIGTGGFAKVYGATQLDLGRSVALKVLSRGLDVEKGLDEELAERASKRFRREARLVSQLRDPNTITIFDYGESTEGLLYIVFERVNGRSLKEILLADGPLPAARVAHVLACVLSSLEEAHEFGILHRDIKPANIMLFDHVGRPGVKLLDFGIAKVGSQVADLSSSSVELTREGALVGTPRYMSPEQIRDLQMTPASDLFSLGLVAYEMLTAEQANAGDSPVTVIGRQLDDRPFTLPWRDDIPLGLRTMVHRLLEKDVDQRYQTAAEAAAALQGWDEEPQDVTLDVVLVPLDVPVEEEPAPQPVDESEDELPAADAQGRPLAFVFIAIAAVCVLALVALANREEPAAAPTEPTPAEPIVVAVEAEVPAPNDDAATTPSADVEEVEPQPKPAQPPRPRPRPKPKPKPEPKAPTEEPQPDPEPPTDPPGDEKPGFFSLDDAL